MTDNRRCTLLQAGHLNPCLENPMNQLMDIGASLDPCYAIAGKVLPLQQGEEAGEDLFIVHPADAMVRQGSTEFPMSIKNICPFFLAEGQSNSTSSVFRCIDLVAASFFISLIRRMRNYW